MPSTQSEEKESQPVPGVVSVPLHLGRGTDHGPIVFKDPVGAEKTPSYVSSNDSNDSEVNKSKAENETKADHEMTPLERVTKDGTFMERIRVHGMGYPNMPRNPGNRPRNLPEHLEEKK